MATLEYTNPNDRNIINEAFEHLYTISKEFFWFNDRAIIKNKYYSIKCQSRNLLFLTMDDGYQLSTPVSLNWGERIIVLQKRDKSNKGHNYTSLDAYYTNEDGKVLNFQLSQQRKLGIITSLQELLSLNLNSKNIEDSETGLRYMDFSIS